MLLTGPCNTFKYIRKDLDNNLSIPLSEIHELDAGRKISNNYTCHAWSQSTGHILVCTDGGEMIICENNGVYKAFVLQAKIGPSIDAVVSLDNGFLVAQGAYFSIYRTSRVDERSPLELQGQILMQIVNEPQHMHQNNTIESMCLDSKEGRMYVLTNQGQLIAGNYNFKNTSQDMPYGVTFDYVQGMFHKNKNEITGLDTCIRKQLIVTCSRDKTVCIWDYANRRLEFQHTFPEELVAVAFHPSGLHVVVAMQDKIEIYNVLSDKLTKSKTINLKGCNEIKFSHGGHLFACVAN